MSSGQVCRFFEQGRCRYGANCRYIHPSGGQAQASNSFRPAAGKAKELPYNLDPEILRRDLTEERPPWILSAFGPGRDAPEQLFGGPGREQSFEEMRLHYMMGMAAGNPQGALQDIENLNLQAQGAIQQAAGNLDAAIQYIVDGANKHPNRIDVCQQFTRPGGANGVFERGKQQNPAFGGQQQPASAFGGQTGTFGAPSQPAAGGQTGVFGAPSQPAAGGFGQTPTLGQKPSVWGQPSQAASTPAFGQPSQPTGGFGQPSQPTGGFGQPSQPAGGFGQAPTLGAKPSVWGQPAQPANAPAFGQPSQPTGAPAFGQPSQPAGGPVFGQPSQPGTAFGQTPTLGQKPNPWGQPSQPAAAPAFGQPSQPAAGVRFGQPSQPAAAPAFGQPSQPAAAPAFGQPSQPAAAPAFGQPSQPAAAPGFGQPSQPAAAPAFGQPSQPAANNPFGQPAALPAATNPFGQPQQQQQAANPFAAKSPMDTQPITPTNTAAPGPTSNPYGPNATREHPAPSSYSSRNPDGSLRMFKGKTVSFEVLPGGESSKVVPVVHGPGGVKKKIWHPDGPPPYYPDTEALDTKSYEDEGVLRQWDSFLRNAGRFVDGVMPEVPPKREWCVWDF